MIVAIVLSNIADEDLRVETFYSKDLMLLLLNNLYISSPESLFISTLYLKVVFSLSLMIVQVCLEGEISKKSVMNSLSRGKRAFGDLIPWTVSQQVRKWLCFA